MGVRSETALFLSGVERAAGGRLRFGTEIALMLEAACARSLLPEFEELVFQAKFADRASAVLRRAGVGSVETGKMSAEFTVALTKISAHLRHLLSDAAASEKAGFEERFLSLSPPAMENLVALCSDLARVKNYLLDGHTLPCASGGNTVS